MNGPQLTKCDFQGMKTEKSQLFRVSYIIQTSFVEK